MKKMTDLKLIRIASLCLSLFLILQISCIAQTSSKAEELHKELNNDNFEEVKQIIDQDISLLESPNPKGSTPLTVAAAGGHTDLVKFFIVKGADVNRANNFGNTPLHYAAWASDFEAFKNLHEQGANLEAKNSRGQTILEYSCMGGNFEIVSYCVSKKMDINAKNEDESTLIHWAAYGGNAEIFKFLESEGLDIDAKDRDGSSPIFWAVAANKIDIVKYLVEEKNVDVNIIDDIGSCPLKEAVKGGSFEVTKYLLDKGADINFQMEENVTFLELAAQNNNPELVLLLIDNGCKVNVFDDFGNTPLTTAAGHGNLNVVKVFVDNGANLEPGICKRKSCISRGQTPLHAASWRNPEIMEYLIEQGADVNVQNLDGNAPLHGAARSDSIRSVDVLCKNGGNVNIQNKKGITPLIIAIKNYKPEIMNSLVKYKADVTIADNFDRTPLHYAAIAGYGNLVDVLIKNGADIHAKDKDGQTPVYYAVLHGNKKIAENLFKSGADKRDMPFEKAGLLKKELLEGEALIWYLNHSGWAVKTKNHLLVFDYWQRTDDPDYPCLNNGRINPEEISEQNVIVFSSHTHGDHFSREIFEWNEDIKNINYVLGFETTAHDDYTYISPRNEKIIDNVKITPISSTDSGEGFMVELDGLSIYHPGDHANRYQEGDEEFSDEIDFLAKKYNSVDIAFVPISGCNFRDKVALVKGNDYMIKKFNPALVLPMHAGGGEDKYKEYADERNKVDNKSLHKYVLNKGDRLFYEKSNLKL